MYVCQFANSFGILNEERSRKEKGGKLLHTGNVEKKMEIFRHLKGDRRDTYR